MADPRHLAILRQGVETWNKWREENRTIQPDLIGADLRGADLSGANLKDANLFNANLQGADLRWAHLIKANLFETNLSGAKLFRADLSMANFVRAKLYRAHLVRARMYRTNMSRANLCNANLHQASLPRAILFGARLVGANLKGADLSEANLNSVDLSGAIIDKDTNLQRTKDVVSGVNGIYSNSTDSAALIVLSPRGDSMLGPSAEAVVQSLTRARLFHTISLVLGITMMAVLILSPPEMFSGAFGNYKAPIERFALFAMILSAGALSFSKAFMEDALDGTRCLRDRDSAMVVGRFPWILTRFTGHRWDKRILSFISRSCLAFHPAIYLFMPHEHIMWYDWGLGGLMALFSVWVFVLSQKFQRPILFDSKTEVYKKRELNEIGAQLDEVLELIKSGDHLNGKGVQKIPKKGMKRPTQKKPHPASGAKVKKPPPMLKEHKPDQILDPVRPAPARVSSKGK